MATPDRSRRTLAKHGRAVGEIAAVSAIGILATAGFQVVASRGLGPEEFGLFAAFLALVNIAAIGSAALRNSVAVEVARVSSIPSSRRFDSSLIEALVLGAAFTIGLLIATPWLATSLQSNTLALVIAAATVLPYFLFARSLGLLQGTGDIRATVWWTTGAQILQVILALVAVLLGAQAVGLLAVCLLTVSVTTAGASVQSHRRGIRVSSRPFTTNGIVVILVTIAFAWLTNIDVVLVRAGASELVAGSYAAAAVLVKTTLILPATLSLYLLPRFVRSRADAATSRLGVNLTVALTAVGGVMIFAVLTFLGDPIVRLLFGDGYEATGSLLPPLTLMWLPWAMSQAVLVRITAIASRAGLGVLLLAAVAQWLLATLALPDIHLMIALNAAIGVLVLTALYLIHLLAARRAERGPVSAPAVQDPS